MKQIKKCKNCLRKKFENIIFIQTKAVFRFSDEDVHPILLLIQRIEATKTAALSSFTALQLGGNDFRGGFIHIMSQIYVSVCCLGSNSVSDTNLSLV